jgi:ubiquitin C
MQIFIKTLSGKTIMIKVSESDSIENLKQIFEDQEGVPVDQLRLVYREK